jgi:DNA excision repair protein ERCC-1
MNSAARPNQSGGRPGGSGNGPVVQPKPQALPGAGSTASILVSTRQKGNPILNHIRGMPWEYADTPADYILGATTCALFLSLKYHKLHPEYIYARIRGLQGKFKLRIVMVMIDIEAHEESLKELSKTSLINNVTIILAWSAAEAGRYLELFKTYEFAAPTSIKGHQSTNFSDRLVEFVTVPRSVNKTDALGLVSNFGSIRTSVNAQPEEISMIAGWGDKKVQRWHTAVREPFRSQRASKKVLAVDSKTQPAVSDAAMNPIPAVSSNSRSSVPIRQPNRVESTVNDDEPLFVPMDERPAISPASAVAATAPSRKRPAEPEMTDGVLAALSKLRDQA